MTSLPPLDPPKTNGSGEFNTPAEPYLFDAAEDLSPLLKQGRSIEPLVIAIAFLALLQPLSLASPDVEGSAWMLRAVSLANSESSSEWLIPGISEKLPARFLPPGITWLQACFLKQLGVQNYWYLPLISYLAGACGIWWSWRLVRLLADSRMALIMVVMLSVHGQLFRIVGSAAPWALCWALTIAALLLFSLHLKKSPTFWSWRLVASGVLVGVAILCGGILPLALIGPVGLACGLLTQIPDPKSAYTASPPAPTLATRGVWGTAVVLLIGGILGGWWIFFTTISCGWPAFQSWFTGQFVHAETTSELLTLHDFVATSARLKARHTWLVWTAPLIGWQILGVLVLVNWKGHRWPESMTQFVRPWLIMTMAIGLAGWGFVIIQDNEQQLSLNMWQTILLFSTTMLAVIGLESILRRETRGRALAMLSILTAMWCVWGIYQNRHIRFTMATASLFLLFFAVAAGLIWWRTIQLHYEAQRRRVIKVVIASLLAIQFVWGYVMLERPQEDVACLLAFTKVLSSVAAADSVCIVSPQGVVPPQIELAARVAQPQARISIQAEACEFTDSSPTASHLVVEWSRRDRKGVFRGPTGHMVESINEPLRFRGRRLLIWQIRPQNSGVSQTTSRLD